RFFTSCFPDDPDPHSFPTRRSSDLFWQQNQAAYNTILGFAPRLLLASFIAYLVGEFTNSFVLAKLKIATRGRWLWTRTIGSTLIDRKSTRLNSSHVKISYAVFCLKK